MDAEIAVSVIISTRNRAPYLADCLNSLGNQICSKPLEIIVIDNGSTDETPAVIQRWHAKDPRFRTAREERLGFSRGRNAGIRMARGDLFIFTDDDVVVQPNWIEAYCDFFAHRDQPVLVGGPIVPVPDDLGDWPDWFDKKAVRDVGLLDYQQKRPLERWEYVWGANMAVPRRIFDEFGLWDETLGPIENEPRKGFADVEFQDRIKHSGGSAWFCPGAVVHHRIDRRTITSRGVITTAFTRGLSEFWQESLRTWGDADLAPKRDLTKCLTALVQNLTLWVLWAIAFRFLSNKGLFERARCAAHFCGRSLGCLRAGRESMLSYRVIAQGTFLTRRLVLRLSRDNL